jgi:hypothetical protein
LEVNYQLESRMRYVAFPLMWRWAHQPFAWFRLAKLYAT